MKNLCITIIILILLCSKSFATTYYIDVTSGNNSNNGTSLLTAFQTCTPIEGTNFLQPGDTVNISAGEIWQGSNAHCKINSAGSASQHITIQSSGVGAHPIFNGSIPQASISGWTGWTLFDGTNHIWKSNVTIGFASGSPIIDGSYNLKVETTEVKLQSFPQRYFRDGSNFMYIRLVDNSDPNGHTVEFPEYPNDGASRGIIRNGEGVGGYMDFISLDTYGSLRMGISSADPYVTFTNCKAQFSERESFYFVDNVPSPPGANYNTCTGCTGRYAGATGGQNFTVESDHVSLINILSEYGWFAGVDFLGYQANTPASNGLLKDSIIRYNAFQSVAGENFGDPQIYCDGCNNVQIINDTIIGNSANASFPTGQTTSDGINIGSENPTTNIPHDIYIDNVNVSQNTFCALEMRIFSTANLIYNVTVLNSTFFGDSNDGGFLASVKNFDTTHGASFHMHNNIFYQGSSANTVMSFDNSADFDGDYNDVSNSTANQAVFYFNSSNKYTVAQWNTLTGQEAHSISANPRFVSATNLRLQRIALGQANNSPAIQIGKGIYVSPTYYAYLVGTTRTDDVQDNRTTPDLGWHYNAVYTDRTENYTNGVSFTNGLNIN